MTFGRIAFLGSGETSRAGGAIFENLARMLPQPLRIAVLETPAGFEPNSDRVAGRVADFVRVRLRNYMPEVDVIPARRRGTAFSPDDPDILKPLLRANLIFMGPGSPTYAIRQLHGSLAWELIRARYRLGASLAFASSATIAVGAWGLPVYEVYKAGEDMHNIPGLNFFGDFGLHLSFIPHWNNAEGGEEVDTSRCFMGMERFDAWSNSLPTENTTVGLDEHTGLTIDLETNQCEVSGVSSVTLLHGADPRIYPAGARFELSKLGSLDLPDPIELGISLRAWELATGVSEPEQEQPSAVVLDLAHRREQARAHKNWAEADLLREQIAALGWQVQDTNDRPTLTKDLPRFP
jgi:cyanophycinase-like exopeptidase